MINTCFPSFPPMAEQIPPATPLPSCPERSVGLSLPVPINARLDLLVRLAAQAGERTSRKELAAACILGRARWGRRARALTASLPQVAGSVRLPERPRTRGRARAAPCPSGAATTALAPPLPTSLTVTRRARSPRRAVAARARRPQTRSQQVGVSQNAGTATRPAL